MTQEIRDIHFCIKVPLSDVDNTDLNQVGLDIKSSLEREHWKITDVRKNMSQEETIEFARKYLEVRKRKGTDETNPSEPYWTWEIATEYVLLDIIPYIFGEALD